MPSPPRTALTAFGATAEPFLAGSPDVGRPDDVLRAGSAFHDAVRDVARPSYLDLRDDPWTIGDRVAWEELPVEAGPHASELLEPLAAARWTCRGGTRCWSVR